MKKFLVTILFVLTACSLVWCQSGGNVTALSPLYNPPANTLTAACTSTCPVLTVTGNTVGVVTVSGANSALALQLLLSNDGTNFNVPATLTNGAGGVDKLTTITVSGTYYFSLTGMTKLKESVTTLTGTNVIIKVTATNAGTTTFVNPNPPDPCIDSNVAKQTVAVTITTATTTQLVALSAGQKIYPCKFQATFGASTTVSFEYGTGSSCGTGTTSVTGVFTPSTAAEVNVDDLQPTPAGNAYCAVSTGTGGINGQFTFAQR